LLQLDLKSLKPSEAQLLALTAIECSASASPPSVVAVIQWAKPFQPLNTIPEPVQQELAKTFGKWNPRWQKQLAGQELPPILSEVIKAKLTKVPNQLLEQRTGAVARTHSPEPLQHSGQHSRHPQVHQPRKSHPLAVDTNQPEKSYRQKSEKPLPNHQRPIPDLSDLLKEVEAHFNLLREELQFVKNQLRQSQIPAKQTDTHSTETGKEVGKLREENARLTETVRVLRETLNDLASQNFDQAVSRKADTEAPVTDPVEQYKSFLTLKLREQIVNFQTLNRENHVDGIPLLLDNILRTLQESGIDLENIEAPPPQARRRY
jgi:chromosome segregation ATPase